MTSTDGVSLVAKAPSQVRSKIDRVESSRVVDLMAVDRVLPLAARARGPKPGSKAIASQEATRNPREKHGTTSIRVWTTYSGSTKHTGRNNMNTIL